MTKRITTISYNCREKRCSRLPLLLTVEHAVTPHPTQTNVLVLGDSDNINFVRRTVDLCSKHNSIVAFDFSAHFRDTIIFSHSISFIKDCEKNFTNFGGKFCDSCVKKYSKKNEKLIDMR